MTFKSMRHTLQELESSGRLVRFLPDMDRDESEKRRLLMTPAISQFLKGNYPRKVKIDYYARIRARLGHYVKGFSIEDNDDFFKQLHPYGQERLKDFWEIRITFDPHSRIFGAFAAKDCFVAMRAKFRDDCGKEFSRGFKRAISACESDWNSLFGSLPRFRCFPLPNCISV